MACTKKGQDMSLETFRKALEYDECIGIGGGEPTIHPQFWEMLGLAIGRCDSVWLATNGKQTETALALARLAQKGVIGCALSQDPYHEKIDKRVVEAFKKSTRDAMNDYSRTRNIDMREIRDTSKHLINAGRCDWGKNDCICPELFVQPDGNVRECGCADAPIIGNVFDGFETPESYESECCHAAERRIRQNA
jgi:MoaA/NifB/PqqE/SkfB family radical SAM enzyme